jgi:peptidoglycan/LPS O-acetylase OafA/YrhL
VSEFFISRSTRLVPLYVLAVVLSSAVLTLLPYKSATAPQPSHALYNLTMLQGFLGVPHVDSVYWTLLVELKFYFLWVIVVSLGLTYRRAVAACGIWMILALYAGASSFTLAKDILMPDYAFYFIAGILLYLIYRYGQNLLLWGMYGVCVIACISHFAKREAQWAHGTQFQVGAILLVACFVLMAAVALHWLDWVRWQGFAVLGALTYPVYLLHQQIGRVFIEQTAGSLPPWVLLGIAVTLFLGACHLAHRFFERPVAAFMKRRLRDSFAKIREASSGVTDHRFP